MCPNEKEHEKTNKPGTQTDTFSGGRTTKSSAQTPRQTTCDFLEAESLPSLLTLSVKPDPYISETEPQLDLVSLGELSQISLSLKCSY